jgi:hypothetical protein
MDQNELDAALQAINRHRCQPPLPEAEVSQIAASIARYPAGNLIATYEYSSPGALLSDWNQRFAIVAIGGKVFVVEFARHGMEFFTPAQFALFYQPVRVWVPGEKQPKLANATEVWLNHPARRQFRKTAFEPCRESDDETLNLWTGFAVDAHEGHCELFLAHVRENICAGDARLFEFVMGWLAQMFQEPMKKIGTALVLRGKQGTGKTFFGRTVGFLLGTHYRIVSQIRHVTGNFNRHIEVCLLLEAEEAFWAGDKEAEGTLKHLITSDAILIERKGVDAYEAKNYTRVLITSNSDWVVPAGLEERRFAVLDVGEEHLQDSAYFAAIQSELDRGGYEALLHRLLTWNYDAATLRKPPRTAALDQQKIASLSTEHGWLLDLLERGSLPGDTSGSGESPAEMLRDDYIRHAKRVGRSHRSIDTALGQFLRRAMPGIAKRRGTFTTAYGREKDGPIWVFPPLTDARRAFRQALHLAFSDDDVAGAEWEPAPDPMDRDEGPM